MEKKTGGLLGAIAGLATMGSAHAAIHAVPNPSEVLQVASYADLLAPIPDAVALLKADDETRAQKPATDAPNGVQLAQGYYNYYNQPQYYGNPYPYSNPNYYNPPPYYHHHHHHHQYRRYHHHHHHHHHGAFIGVPGLGGLIIGGR